MKTAMALAELPVLCCTPVLSERLSDDETATLAAAFAALSDPTRLLLLNLVANTEGGEACACDLVTPTGRSQPTVSHHLKVLVEAGLLTREQRGKWAWFAPNAERLDALRQALTRAA
ncbi:MAG TPA: metalloregulator ArsR/SmtB family transcription factor [Nitriliruptorales bacterium]|jgi:ArsR family transcriptional regulator